MTHPAIVIAAETGILVEAPLSAWHAAGRFTFRPRGPGEDPVLRLVGLTRAEADRLAAEVNAQVGHRETLVRFGAEAWCPEFRRRKRQDRDCNRCMRTSCRHHPVVIGPFAAEEANPVRPAPHIPR